MEVLHFQVIACYRETDIRWIHVHNFRALTVVSEKLISSLKIANLCPALALDPEKVLAGGMYEFFGVSRRRAMCNNFPAASFMSCKFVLRRASTGALSVLPLNPITLPDFFR
jgi:hypothetical protein